MSDPDRDREPVEALRDLTTAEKEICARHPLPPGVDDAVVNKTQLCEALDVSPTTLSAWLRLGLPYENAGSNGKSYEFRLSVAFAWSSERKARDDAGRQKSEASVAQLRLALLGDDRDGAASTARLSPREQRELIDVERVYMAAARERGELIRREAVRDGIAEVWAGLRDRLDALPDMLARALDLTGEEIEAAEKVCDGLLADAVKVVRGIIGDE